MPPLYTQALWFLVQGFPIILLPPDQLISLHSFIGGMEKNNELILVAQMVKNPPAMQEMRV